MRPAAEHPPLSAASILARSATETTTAKAGGDNSKLAGGPRSTARGVLPLLPRRGSDASRAAPRRQATTGGTAEGVCLAGFQLTPVLSQQSGGGGGGGGGGATFSSNDGGSWIHPLGIRRDDQSSTRTRRSTGAYRSRRPSGVEKGTPTGAATPTRRRTSRNPGSTAALSAPRTRRGSKSGKTGGAGPRSPPPAEPSHRRVTTGSAGGTRVVHGTGPARRCLVQ